MAIGKPKLVLALVVALLAVLAGTITYTGYLVIGVIAEYLGTGRFVAGLLLGILFARFPSVSQGKLRLVGLLPKPVRRPLMVTLVALCLLHFVWQGDYVPAVFTLFDRVSSSFFKFMPGRRPPERSDDMVIEGEFKERKE
jgi:hypothetical protein